jgi:hypothetical protein
MHGIKYIFLNKNNQTIQENKLSKTLPKNTIFQNPVPLKIFGSAPTSVQTSAICLIL